MSFTFTYRFRKAIGCPGGVGLLDVVFMLCMIVVKVVGAGEALRGMGSGEIVVVGVAAAKE